MPRPADWTPAPHGTAARYLYHVKVDGDTPCDSCKAANAAKSRQYRAENPERVRQHGKLCRQRNPRDRRPTTLRKYGLTEDGYDALLNNQGGRCAICRDDFTPNRGPQIDHDHARGNTRGILCFQCNVGLGNFYDSPSLLTAAADYLKEHDVNRGTLIRAA